jgi:ribose transport system permease protein
MATARPLTVRLRGASPLAVRVVFLVGMVAAFTLLAGTFTSLASVTNVLVTMPYVGIIAVGMTLLLISGEFDLSVGAVSGLAAVTAALLMTDFGLDPGVSIVVALAMCAAIGLMNGLLVTQVGVPSFLATLGTLYVVKGIAQSITQAKPVYPLPPIIGEIGTVAPLGLNWAFLTFIALIIAAELVLTRTVYGRWIYATGGNREAASIAGISTTLVKTANFMIVAVLAGLSGVLTMANLNIAKTNIGTGLELTVIAAVAIGGTSLFGGVGTAIGTLVGMIILQVAVTGLVTVGVSLYWHSLIVGLLMVGSVSIAFARRKAM